MDNSQLQQAKAESLLMSYQLSPVVKSLKDYFHEESFMEILHVERKENYHSNFLKWLFDDKDIFLCSNRYLLLLLLRRHKQFLNSHFPTIIQNALLSGSFSIESVKTILEENVYSGNKKGRCDLRIEISYRISDLAPASLLYVLVENKVFSGEHCVSNTGKPQTTFYFEQYEKKYHKENCLFVFLNLIDSIKLNSLSQPECDCKQYIQINYQDILDNILNPIINDSVIPPRKLFIIQEYIKSLSMNQKNTIMAMDKKLRDLLISFWNKNQELIEMSIRALKEDPDLEIDVRDSVSKMQNAVQIVRKKKDDTHYRFNSVLFNGKSDLIDGVLSFLISSGRSSEEINTNWNYLIENIDLNKPIKAFPKDQRWTIDRHFEGNNNDDSANKVLKTEVKIIKNQGRTLLYQDGAFTTAKEEAKTDIAHNYVFKEIDQQQFWRYNQWGWKNIDFFIKLCREKYGLSIDIEYD